MPARPSVTITGLFIYPIKSCRGIALRESPVTVRGLAHDREWLVVKPDGEFVTQRQFPRLALIETTLTHDALTLRAPGMTGLSIPLALREMPRRDVSIWRHACTALDEGDAAAKWFSEFLGDALRLVRFDPAHVRPSPAEWVAGAASENRFPDAFPVLVLAEESVVELNRRLGAEGPLPADRFRTNILIAGGGPHFEDRAGVLRGDGVELRLVKPCVRCRVTTTDQRTAEVGKEPLRTLATYRNDEALGGVTFGMNALVTAGTRLAVGMQLR